MSNHIVNGEFQSDKYPTTPRNCVPLKITDKAAQDLLWQYAKRHRMRDQQFSDDLEACLLAAGFIPPQPGCAALDRLVDMIADLPNGALGYVSQTTPPYRMDIISLALHGLRMTLETLKAAEYLKSQQNGDV